MLDAAPETMAKKISQSAKSFVADAMDASAAAGGSSAKFETKDVVGALSIFCGGLVMAIDDKMPMAAEQLAEVLGHNNTMGVCCFGEQGMDHCRRATHGNLMFGCLLFSNKRRETDKAQATLTELGDDAGTASRANARAKASSSCPTRWTRCTRDQIRYRNGARSHAVKVREGHGRRRVSDDWLAQSQQYR